MDSATKNDILQGLGMLKASLLKEYSLNTRPQDYKGENASDESLPADWQTKLKPISGGQGGFNSGDNGPDKKNTSTGSQSDPYIHKQLEEMQALMKQMAENLSMGGDSIDDNGDDDMEWDTEDVGGDEVDAGDMNMDVVEDDDEMDIEKMGHGMDKQMPLMNEGDDMGMEGGDDSDMSSIVDALNEIKGILSQMDFAKAQAAKLEKSIDDKFATMQKQMATQSNQAKVSQAVTDILKQHGLSELPSDVPVRTQGGVTVKSSIDPVPQPSGNEINSNDDGSFQKSDDMLEDRHNTFVGQVSSIVNRHGVDDLKGTFALVNQMRTEQVSDLSTPLYYYDNINVPN